MNGLVRVLGILLVIIGCCPLFSQLHFNFKRGDILFQDCDCGAICDAIEDVTQSRDHKRYSHIAIVVLHHKKLQIIEANSKGVVLVPIQEFIHRYHDAKGLPSISIGRLTKKHQYLIPIAESFLISKLGKEYDTAFSLDNDQYYCSELIYEAYRYANHENPFFRLYPMTFKKPMDSNFHPEFQRYYQSIRKEIPEGKLGINPGSISRDSKIQILYLDKK